MPRSHYYITCPLCQQNVEPTQPDSCRVMPLNHERMAVFNETPVCDINKTLTVGDLKVDWGLDFPSIPYMEMAWLVHTRCISFVDHLSLPKLYLLLDIVSPNVLSNKQFDSPGNQHGAFYAESTQEEEEEENPVPESPSMSPVKRLARNFWGVVCALSCCCTTPAKEQMDKPSGLSLPPEIWNFVLRYDIGRLLFIMKTAAQLSKLDIQHKIPNTRLSAEILNFSSSMVQIHLINIGGRTYISNLSNSTGDHGTAQSKDTLRYCDISRSNCIAVKSDGIGIVDIAFEAQDGRPDWVLHNSTEPFGDELCQIRNANLQSLHIFRDGLKCRAIVPFRQGPEAYIQGPPFPPRNCWATPGILTKSKLSEVKGPFTHFTTARYIPFSDLRRITLDSYSPGVVDVYVNKRTKYEQYSVTFDEPPKVVKYLVCRSFQDFPLIQFNINKQWLPRLPEYCTVVREKVFENVVGLWCGYTFPYIPVYIRLVVSQPTEATEFFSWNFGITGY